MGEFVFASRDGLGRFRDECTDALKRDSVPLLILVGVHLGPAAHSSAETLLEKVAGADIFGIPECKQVWECGSSGNLKYFIADQIGAFLQRERVRRREIQHHTDV